MELHAEQQPQEHCCPVRNSLSEPCLCRWHREHQEHQNNKCGGSTGLARVDVPEHCIQVCGPSNNESYTRKTLWTNQSLQNSCSSLSLNCSTAPTALPGREPLEVGFTTSCSLQRACSLSCAAGPEGQETFLTLWWLFALAFRGVAPLSLSLCKRHTSQHIKLFHVIFFPVVNEFLLSSHQWFIH